MTSWLSKIPSRADWIVPFIIAALTAFGAQYVRHDDAKAAADKAREVLERRVSDLEIRQGDETKKIDHIQEQVDRLVSWAMGR